jgi:SAM-dependent methyltransferase
MINNETASENINLQNDRLGAEEMQDFEFEPRENCPLCGAAEPRKQFALDRFSVVRCSLCNFLYVSNVLGEIAIQNLYKEGYDNQRHIHGQRVNASVNINVLGNLIPDIRNKSILDVGSGYGFLLQSASHRYGMRVAGVELSLAERKYAQEKLGVATYKDIFEIPKNERFDVVTAFEVIEHVRDPVSFVNTLIDHLNIGGYLIIATDNFESEVVKRLGTGFPKWIPHEHICYFSPNSLNLLLNKFTNLRIIGSCSFTPWELQLRSILERISYGRLGHSSYQFGGFASELPDKGYRWFHARLALNSLFSRLTMEDNLNGEMMFVCAMKIEEQRWLALDAQQRQNMAQQARATFAQRFTVEAMASSLLATLKRFSI